MRTKLQAGSRRPWLISTVVGLGSLFLCMAIVLGQGDGGAKKLPIKPKDAPLKGSIGSSKADKSSTASPAPKSDVAKNPATPKPATPAEAGGSEGSFVDQLVTFIRTRAAWILGGLGILLAGVLAWAYISGRGKRGEGEDPFAELGLGEKAPKAASPSGPTRFSSTKIQAADVNSRLSGSMKTTEVETDREYALVVDEDALKMPPLPEEPEQRETGAAANRLAESGPIEKLLDTKNWKAAYKEYARQVDANATTSFHGEVERKLAEHLIQAKELEKATRVLEHHVATHPRKEVQPDVFFNLGYIHFLRNTFGKSRRYLTLFVETEKNPAYIARAKKILARIKSTPAQN